MNENCGAEFFCCAPNWLERGVVEVQRVSPTGEWTVVHVRADLRAAESELTNTTFQLARSKIDILQRYRGQAGKSFGITAHDFRDVIVQAPGKIEGIGRLCPIAEHYRHSREHLHGNFCTIAVVDAAFRVPDAVCDFAKDAIADHHPGAARFVMIEPHKPAVAVLRIEIGPLAGQNVSVNVDLHLPGRYKS